MNVRNALPRTAQLFVLVVASSPWLRSCGSDAEVAAHDARTPAPSSQSASTREATAVGTLTTADEPRRDFGVVVEGSRLEHTFRLVNSSTNDASVQHVRSDCGCTVATPMLRTASGSSAPYTMEEPIPPGATLEIGASYDTLGKKQSTSVTIAVSVRGMPEPIHLVLAATVSPYVRLDPNPLDLGLFTSAESRAGEIRITSPPAGKFKLTTHEESIPTELVLVLTPHAADTDGFASEWTLTATLGPNLPKHPKHYFGIPIRCDWPEAVPLSSELSERLPREITASVLANVTGDIAVKPDYIAFGELRSEVASSSVEIFAPAASALDFELELEDVRLSECQGIPPEHATIALERKSPKSFELKLTVSPAHASQRVFRGVATVELDSGDALRIPYFGLVAGK